MFAFQTAFTHIEQAAINMDPSGDAMLTGSAKGSSQASMLSQKKMALAKNNPRNVPAFLEVRKELVLRRA